MNLVIQMNKKEIAIISILLILDQLTKYWTTNISLSIIPNFLSFISVSNTGAAWNILNNNTWILIIITIICLVLLTINKDGIPNVKGKNWILGLVYAGMMGNLLDRFVFHYVRDFISIQIFKYQYPVFNLADMYIVIGMILLFIILVKGDSHEKDNGRKLGTKRTD